MHMNTKYIIVNGGNLSGVGKGIITSSIGKILQEYGFTVTAIKIDPYINVDSGTLNPKEHGEVWVTYDGRETDQDIGNYERFLGIKLPAINSITTGQIYQSVIEKERNGFYKGKTVQLIPHITEEVRNRIIECGCSNSGGLNGGCLNGGSNGVAYDFVLVEIGGIVGDYENIPFLAGTKSLESMVGKENVLYCLVTYMPIPSHLGEMKTKPTQTAIREIMQHGIIPDLIFCRGKDSLDDLRKSKIETYVNINKEYIISVPDANSIYNIPLILEEQTLGFKIFKKLNTTPRKNPDWNVWKGLVNSICLDSNCENSNCVKSNTIKHITIAIVCKYLATGNYQLTDSYLSVKEALLHASAHLNVKINIKWIDSNSLMDSNIVSTLNDCAGVLVPGGFGSHGVDGKILTIKHVRTNNIPFLGICYGMQLAVVEYARNECNMIGAHTSEVDESTTYPVITILENKKHVKQLGGTLRLGEYKSKLLENSIVSKLYRGLNATERHRHRYEVNPTYVDQLTKNGLTFSGKYNDPLSGCDLMEFLEISQHKFFVATQSHPELTSTLLKPNPLFVGFVTACM